MCCREGVDKRPKAPKAAVSAKATLKGNLTGTTKHSVAKTSNPTAKNPAKGMQPYKIDVVDLSAAKPREDYGKFGPKSYKSLEKLHKSTINGTPARVIVSKRSTPFAMGRQTQISFLGKAVGSPNSAGKASSNYGNDMIDEVPSHLAFVQGRRLSTSSGPAASLRFDEDVSELEAVMADLGDPMASEDLYRDPSEERYPSQSKGRPATCPHEEVYNGEPDSLTSHLDDFSLISPLPTENVNTSQIPAKDDRLFIHTSSPQKPPQGISYESNDMKRRSMDLLQAESSHNAPPMKKRRLAPEADGDQALRSVSVTDYQEPHVAHSAKPGWVDGIDPELLAEFGDIVDFY